MANPRDRCGCCQDLGVILIPYWHKPSLYALLDNFHAMKGYPLPKIDRRYWWQVYLRGAMCHKEYLCTCSAADRLMAHHDKARADEEGRIRKELKAKGKTETGIDKKVAAMLDSKFPPLPPAFSDQFLDCNRPPTWGEIEKLKDRMVADVLTERNIQLEAAV